MGKRDEKGGIGKAVWEKDRCSIKAFWENRVGDLVVNCG